MYSDAAKPAMTSELRGQNSWLNFGPHGEANRTAKAADTVFADQKIGVMPPWSYREGMGGGMGLPLMAPKLVGHPGSGLHDPYSQPPPLAAGRGLLLKEAGWVGRRRRRRHQHAGAGRP